MRAGVYDWYILISMNSSWPQATIALLRLVLCLVLRLVLCLDLFPLLGPLPALLATGLLLLFFRPLCRRRCMDWLDSFFTGSRAGRCAD